MTFAVEGVSPPGVTIEVSHQQSGGNGLFACRDFAAGEQILIDEALAFVISTGSGELRDIHSDLLGSRSWEQLVRSTQGQALFRGQPDSEMVSSYTKWVERELSGVEAKEREERLQALLAITFNAYSSQPNANYKVVYPTISKVNHSCFPNTYAIAPEDGPGQLICLRSLSSGEELRVSYLTDVRLASPMQLRQELLGEGWEFSCRCVRCVAPVDDVRAFSCPQHDCPGFCVVRCCGEDKALSAVDGTAVATTSDEGGGSFAEEGGGVDKLPLSMQQCGTCGRVPPFAQLEDWKILESELCDLLNGMPETMYAAWARCEDFSLAHPRHWLSGRWKRHLAAHVQREALTAETLEEQKELQAEAAAHSAVAEHCLQQALGVRVH